MTKSGGKSATLLREVRIVAVAVFLLTALLVIGATRNANAASEVPTVPTKAPVSALEKESPVDIADLQEIEESLVKLRDKMIASTVCVTIPAMEAQGSGVLIDEEGYILTAAHVIGRPGLRATVTFSDGTHALAETLGVDDRSDAGVLRLIESREFEFSPMAKSGSIKSGNWCVAVGHPGGYVETRPPVVRIGRVINARRMVQTDCTLVGGDSGGPLFNLQGEVIGINSRIGTATSLNYHVSINIFHRDWDELSQPAGFLGVQGDPTARNCLLRDVPEGNPAAQAGLKAGDVIVKVDEKEIGDFDDLADYVARKHPGDKIKVVVERDSETLEFEVTLARRPTSD